ncbi:hypothetical protein jhhlp_007183 [Lomentospora prolificans]|uniref:Glycosyltransferase family 69 protein n=1 Tax=Lomentospora prolificans TaxID=41688 RepID=A0A2N3N1X8_9PEZI|nr:hypothetical protein jhhlp_007183 [Lomentospora prolificans]
MTLVSSGSRRKGRASPPPSLLPLTEAKFHPRSSRSGLRLRARRFLRSRAARLFILLFVFWNCAEVFLVRSHLATPPPETPSTSTTKRRAERVYVASLHWNDGWLVRKYWNDAVVGLAEALGPQNIFVSVYESGSWDDTKEGLEDLDRRLEQMGVARNITLSDVTHEAEIAKVPEGPGWIETPRGQKELRRIPFLADLRNRTLRDLLKLRDEGIHFDKVLFLNDVVFKTEDVLTLLDTNDGTYAAACSLDVSDPPNYYDTFALRDSEGDTHLMQTWPYFRSKVSRKAMVGNWPAVPVRSCWNGIVAMQAEPFVAKTPLSFRALPDSLAAHHLEASECCLIHADNPLSQQLGVYLNPRVRVGYNSKAYAAINPASGSWVSPWQIFKGLWGSRILRWVYRTEARDWIVKKRVEKWMDEWPSNKEPGDFCIINEMQVLVENGWAHV